MFSTNPCRQLRWGADGDTCFAMLRALCGMPNVDSAIQESCQSSLRGKHRTCSCHIMWYNVMCNCMRVYIYYYIILYYIILWHIILDYIKLYYYIYNNVCVCACCLLTCGRTTKERESLPISGGSWTGRMPRMTQLWVRGTQWFLPERHDPSPSWIRDLIA